MARPALGRKRATGGRRGRGGRLPLTGPPLGTYDPALDYQLRASQRGLTDLIEDTRRGNQRTRIDHRTGRRIAARGYGRDRADLRRGFAQGQEDIGFQRRDLGVNFTRDLTDLATARQRGEEDYARTLANLQRQYAAQEFNQEQNSLAQGVSLGGTMEASDRVRAANQAYERTGIDSEHQRFLTDLAQEEGRAREDFGFDTGRLDTALSRLGQEFGLGMRRTKSDFRAQGRLDRRQVRRTLADSAQSLSRAKREQGLYEPSVIQQQYFQAHQYNPRIRFPRAAALSAYAAPRRRRLRR